MNKALIRLKAELLCESHKKGQKKRLQSLISVVAEAAASLKLNKKDQTMRLAEALFRASDASNQDIEIVDNKIFISTPMYIDPEELCKRVLW
jgi:hypothetical protein